MAFLTIIRQCLILFLLLALVACGGSSGGNPDPTDPLVDPQNPDPPDTSTPNPVDNTDPPNTDLPEQQNLNLDSLYNYVNQPVPAYIQKDNSGSNTLTDIGATLGRVLFYDVQLSSDSTVSCATCHLQELGFADADLVSTGVNGTTERHSMRLVNLRFGDEERFFWNERAESLEDQSTQPIKDQLEMGFSGEDGAPGIADLLVRLSSTSYYPQLFVATFGNDVITEERIQLALSQFMRSIQSFDTRYDAARSQVADDNVSFPGFSELENEGKRLFMTRGNFNQGIREAGGGLGCNNCHRAPEFDIDPDSRNNGVVSVANNLLESDIANIRAPSLRGLFDKDGVEIGPFMHDGSLSTLDEVLDHYNQLSADPLVNVNLDDRLTGAADLNGRGAGQQLQLNDTERNAVIAFLKTLSGQAVYSDLRWSDPFGQDGALLDLLSE